MGALSTPRTAVLSRPSSLLDRRLPLRCGQSLHPAPTSHPAGPCMTRHQRGFTQFTRPVFPSPAAPGWNEPPLRLSPGLRTPPTKSRRRTPGWGQATEHGPGTTRSTSHPLILQSVVHSQRATSRRTANRIDIGVAPDTPGSPGQAGSRRDRAADPGDRIPEEAIVPTRQEPATTTATEEQRGLAVELWSAGDRFRV